jgi:hypothetical protein
MASALVICRKPPQRNSNQGHSKFEKYNGWWLAEKSPEPVVRWRRNAPGLESWNPVCACFWISDGRRACHRAALRTGPLVGSGMATESFSGDPSGRHRPMSMPGSGFKGVWARAASGTIVVDENDATNAKKWSMLEVWASATIFRQQ